MTGLTSWERIETLRDSNGDVLGQSIFNRDGSSIFSRYAPVGDPGWTSSHVVELPDGARFAFDTTGDTQTISTLDGTVLSRSTWGPIGPEPEAVAENALVGPAVRGISAALTLFAWQSQLNDDKGAAILAFRAYDFQSSGQDNLAPIFVGRTTLDNVEAACPRYGEVQTRTDAATEAIDRERYYPTARERGTAIHARIDQDIKSLRDPNFISELRLDTPKNSNYTDKEYVQLDIFERVGNGTVCVYDIKTGGARNTITHSRAAELAGSVNYYFPDTWRILVNEIRPRR